MLKYKAIHNEIIETEILKETNNQVIFNDCNYKGKRNRSAKITNWYGYFDTKQEAFNFLKGNFERDINNAQQRLNTLNYQLNKLINKYPSENANDL